MTDREFTVDQANQLLDDVIAPWVRELRLSVEAVSQTGATLRMPFGEHLCRDGGIICGQALMTLADTAMVIAVSGASGGYRPMTTVDMTTHLMKPLSGHDVIANTTILRLGRSMAFGNVLIHSAGNENPAVTCTVAYALL